MTEEISVLAFVVLTAIGYFAGTAAESKHYRSLRKREKAFLYLPALTKRSVYDAERVARSQLVIGSVVVSVDYFKRALAALRNIIGGQVSAYESLVDRARREAVLRMKETVSTADMIVNVRIETSSIGQSAENQATVGSVEAIAYGTAVWLESEH